MKNIPSDLARSALDAAPDAMIIIDEDGVVRFANHQLTALFGYAHDEIIGQPVERLMPERFHARHLEHRVDYFARGRMRPMGAGFALFGRRRDGSEFPVEISLSPIEHSGGRLVAAAIRDVTERKLVEAELLLARHTADRARAAADEARENADRANLGKSRFLATASHDLRQPLQALSLLTGGLRRVVKDPDAAEALEQQEQAIGAMSRLLNALLDISKLESGAIKPEPTDFLVAQLFEELRRDFATVAQSKGLELLIERCGTAAVHSDPSLVQQILRNLVSNAIKYTHEGWVRLRCLQDAAFVRLEVLDTGIGISSEQLPHIYEEFFQVGVASNSTREGYGLGLSIVQRLVKLLQLELEVHSEPGKGSSFALRLPASRAHAVAAGNRPAATAHAAPAQRARVLLVEDDPSVRAATQMLLRVEGYEVHSAGNVGEALQSLGQRGPVDLLITDYHLPEGETGVAVVRAARERLGPQLPAVIITGDTSSLIRELPVDTHLRIVSKPVNADELIGTLNQLLLRQG